MVTMSLGWWWGYNLMRRWKHVVSFDDEYNDEDEDEDEDGKEVYWWWNEGLNYK